MDKAIAKKWIKALRSGKYKQGEGKLKFRGKYCCLGVLCELSPLKNFTKTVTEGEASRCRNLILPLSVQKWSGMGSNKGMREEGLALTDHNDRGDSFSKIADTIEKHWKEL